MSKSQPNFIDILRLADNFLLSGQRLCEWCGHGPYLEEDLALSNMALDLLGSCGELYQYLVDNQDKCSEIVNIDQNRSISVQNLIYFRNERNFKNYTLFEIPKGHFGMTMLKNYLLALYALEFLEAWDHPLAKKIHLQLSYHEEHCSYWIKVLSLGSDDTNKSHIKMQQALDEIAPYLNFLVKDLQQMQFSLLWPSKFFTLMKDCQLEIIEFKENSGKVKDESHGEYLGYLLAELQILPRMHPHCNW